MIIRKNNKKKIIIISIIILLLFLITIILVKHKQNKEYQLHIQQEKIRVKQYSSLEQFKTLKEVAYYLDSEFIKQEKSDEENIDYKIYMELSNKIEQNSYKNKEFFEKLIQYSAFVLEYKNFIIIDEKNETTIIVYCDEQESLVGKYYINNIENYFEVKETEKNIQEIKEINPIKIEIVSDELKQVISNNWDSKYIQFGTKESTYRNYDIYFDEGIQVKNVNKKIFNIIFNEKYENELFKNINTKTTNERIVELLGKPHFEKGNLIGYKCEQIYVFFYENEISIYRIEEFETDNIAKIIKDYNSYENIQEFINTIKQEWQDYDVYEYGKNYVKLQYTLKGMCIKFDDTAKRGVILYNNYKGKAYGNIAFEGILNNEQEIPNNIFIENKDLVFETEIVRVNTLDDTSKNNNYKSSIVLNTSEVFKIYKTTLESNKELYKIRFISINNQYPNSELREVISKGIWYDNYNFIYSIKNKGIYIYNVQTRTYITLIEGNDEYIIQSINENILYYDEKSIEVNL